MLTSLSWFFAGWKMKLAVGLWLGLIAGACCWRFLNARPGKPTGTVLGNLTWKINDIFNGNILKFAAILGFCGYTIVLGYKLSHRFPTYFDEVWGPEVAYTDGRDIPQQIRQAAEITPGPHDWPWWRGPTFDNHSVSGAATPVEWSSEENVHWKVSVPGKGHSSPVLSDTSLFLTTANEETKSQMLLAYDQANGHMLWSTVVHQGHFGVKHVKNSYASATPACDGQHVYTVFAIDGLVYLTAVDLSGQIVWQTPVGEYQSQHGYCASPVLYKSIVIVMVYGDVVRRIAAFDRTTGVSRWRSQFIRNGANNGTPIIGNLDGTACLVIPGPYEIQGFDPATGKMEWTVAWEVASGSNTVAIADSRVFATGTDPKNNIICIEAGPAGVQEIWRVTTGAPKVPSPLLVKDQLFLVTDKGIADCLAAATGKRIGRRRLGGNFSSSPVYASGRIYAANEEGRVFVLSADAKLEILASNDMGEPIFATPVISNQRLFVRSVENLYCIGHD